MKRALTILLAAILFCLTAFGQGINGAKDYMAFVAACNAGEDIMKWCDADTVVVLNTDLDFTKEKKVPAIKSFGGKFDGKGHRILGWKSQGGLFSEVQEGGIIKGIVIDASCSMKVSSKATEYNVAFIADVNRGKIENCENHASIAHKCGYTSNTIRIGGIVGFNLAYILHCSNDGNILSECVGVEQKQDLAIEVGGIAGGCTTAKKTRNPVIAWCENSGSVKTATDFPSECVGGITGSSGRCPVKYCINRGIVESCSYKPETPGKPFQAKSGGIVGFGKSDISRCDNFGQVIASGYNVGCAGGIVGMPHAELCLTDCVNYGKVEGTGENGAYVGGIAGNIGRPVHIRRCMNRGDVNVAGLGQRTRSSAGGIVGNVYCPKSSSAGAYIRNCANFARVSSTGGEGFYTAGIVGSMEVRDDLKGFIKDCSNSGKIITQGGRKGNIFAAAKGAVTGGILPDDDAVGVKPLANGCNVYGYVKSTSNTPVKDVVVTDGRQCVQTDEKGYYEMKSDLSEARFIYISLPANANAATIDGVPQFYRRVARWEEAVNADFTLELRDPAKSYTLLMIGDPQVRPYGVDDSMERWYDTVAPDAEAFRQTCNGDVYCINLGDLVYNFMYAYDDYIDAAAQIKCPTFNVMGNHDFDQTTMFDSNLGNMYFETYISPEHYSFNIGDVHYVVLNTILYDLKTFGEHYHYGLDDRAMQWLEEDLRSVPKTSTIVTCSHAAMFKKKGDSPRGSHGAYNKNYNRYRDLLAQYAHVYSWAGHYHSNYYYNYAGKNSKFGAPNIESIVVSRATGALRLNKYLNTNGTPQGYMVVNVNGSKLDWWYKSVGRGKDYQIRAFAPSKTGDGFVKANIFNYSEGWSTPQWFENGKLVSDMEYHPEADPEYVEMYAGVTNKTTRKYCKPSSECEMFRVMPTAGAQSGEIRVKDIFGNEYSIKVEL